MKNLFLYGVIVILISLLVYSWFFRDKKVEYKDSTKVSPQVEAPLVKKYTDPKGDNHSVYDITKNVGKKEDHIPMIDSNILKLNIERDKVREITEISLIAIDSLLQAKKDIDRLSKTRRDSYIDEFVSLDYTFNPDTAIAGKFGFSYRQKLNIIKHDEYKKFLFLKYNYKSLIDISSQDKRSTIEGVNNITILPDEKNTYIKLQAVANNLKFDLNAITTGVGIQIDFKRFSIIGDYVYDLNTREKYSLIQLRTNLIKFKL